MMWEDNLEKAFWQSVEKNTQGLDKAAVLFSGGVDSAVIARAVADKVKDILLICAGLEGAKDFGVAEESAKQMGLKFFAQVVKDKAISGALDAVKEILKPIGLDDSLNLQIGVSEYFAMKAASEKGYRTVFMGQGADELFAGYDAFRKIAEENPERVNEECKKFLEKSAQIDSKRDFAIAHSFGLDLRLIFEEPDFVKAALEVPAAEKVTSGKDFLRKHALRELAEKIGVPEISAKRPKKAMQYGSALGKRVRELL